MPVGPEPFTISTEPGQDPAVEPDWVFDPAKFKEYSRGEGPAANQYWIKLTSNTTLTNPFCSGPLSFRWKTVVAGCTTNYLAGNFITTMVSKQFTATELIAYGNAIGHGGFRIFSESPPCVQVNDLVTVNIRPYHLCLPDGGGIEQASGWQPEETVWTSRGRTSPTGDWIEDVWGPPTFLSADGSSATFRVSGNYETVEVWCRLGRCNTVAQVNKVFNPQPEPSSIVVSGLPGVVAGTATTPAEVCLPANVQTAFTLSLSPMPTTGSDGLLWLIPEGFTCNPPACNTASVEITALKDGAAASGQILCQVNNGQCGRAVAQLNVIRSLVSGYNSIGVTAKRTVLEPIPPNAQWSSNCFYPDLSYQFTLNKAPFNNTYHWTALPGTQVWVNPTGQGTNQFTAGTPVSPTSGTPPALGISVLNQGPGFATGLNCNPNPVEFNNRFLATNSMLNPNVSPALPGIKIDKDGATFNIVTNDINESTTWYANFPCSQTLDAGNFYYEWGFRDGTFEPTAAGADDVNAGEPDNERNDLVFAGTPRNTALNSIEHKAGSFLPGTIIYCRIRKTSASPCGTAADNCFYAYLEYVIPN